MSINSDEILIGIEERLYSVTKTSNLRQLADFFGIPYSTFRGRMNRKSYPYEVFVEKLNSEDLAYVLKGEELGNQSKERTADDDLAARESFENVIKERIGSGVTEKELELKRNQILLFFQWAKDMERLFIAGQKDKSVTPEQLNYEYELLLENLRLKIKSL